MVDFTVCQPVLVYLMWKSVFFQATTWFQVTIPIWLKNHLFVPLKLQVSLSITNIAQSAGAVEYTDCFSAEG